jgi:hypothetical protein
VTTRPRLVKIELPPTSAGKRSVSYHIRGDKAFFPARSTTTWHVPVHVCPCPAALPGARRVEFNAYFHPQILRSRIGQAKDDKALCDPLHAGS